MNIAVIGAGYVGMTTSVAFAAYGHHVVVVEHDEEKVKMLSQGYLPFYEAGMEEMMKQQLKLGQLSFTTSIKKSLKQAEFVFITVGTPSLPSGEANLSYVDQVAQSIGTYIEDYKIIIMKSTVPVGTGKKVQEIIFSQLQKRNEDIPFDLVSNPEFLREGRALKDALQPDRIIIGCENDRAKMKMNTLYNDFQSQILFTALNDAEMIKYASNTFLATKISFVNELARLCEKLNVDITNVAKGMGLDKRIGQDFLQAGIGFGGSCFPKDIKALLAFSAANYVPFQILQAVQSVNDSQVEWFMTNVKNTLGELTNKHIAILGLTFKPETDDIREASSQRVIEYLIQNRAIVSAYDPKGMDQIKRIFPMIDYAQTPIDAIEGADAIILVTEWKELIDLDWEGVKLKLNKPIIFDGRNALDRKRLVDLGYTYIGVGVKGNE